MAKEEIATRKYSAAVENLTRMDYADIRALDNRARQAIAEHPDFKALPIDLPKREFPAQKRGEDPGINLENVVKNIISAQAAMGIKARQCTGIWDDNTQRKFEMQTGLGTIGTREGKAKSIGGLRAPAPGEVSTNLGGLHSNIQFKDDSQDIEAAKSSREVARMRAKEGKGVEGKGSKLQSAPGEYGDLTIVTRLEREKSNRTKDSDQKQVAFEKTAAQIDEDKAAARIRADLQKPVERDDHEAKMAAFEKGTQEQPAKLAEQSQTMRFDFNMDIAMQAKAEPLYSEGRIKELIEKGIIPPDDYKTLAPEDVARLVLNGSLGPDKYAAEVKAYALAGRLKEKTMTALAERKIISNDDVLTGIVATKEPERVETPSMEVAQESKSIIDQIAYAFRNLVRGAAQKPADAPVAVAAQEKPAAPEKVAVVERKPAEEKPAAPAAPIQEQKPAKPVVSEKPPEAVAKEAPAEKPAEKPKVVAKPAPPAEKPAAVARAEDDEEDKPMTARQRLVAEARALQDRIAESDQLLSRGKQAQAEAQAKKDEDEQKLVETRKHEAETRQKSVAEEAAKRETQRLAAADERAKVDAARMKEQERLAKLQVATLPRGSKAPGEEVALRGIAASSRVDALDPDALEAKLTARSEQRESKLTKSTYFVLLTSGTNKDCSIIIETTKPLAKMTGAERRDAFEKEIDAGRVYAPNGQLMDNVALLTMFRPGEYSANELGMISRGESMLRSAQRDKDLASIRANLAKGFSSLGNLQPKAIYVEK